MNRSQLFSFGASCRRIALALGLVALLAGANVKAYAQSEQDPSEVEAPDTLSEEWYEEQLVELSNVLGGAHYLRTLCQGRGDQRWREFMQGVIEREPAHRSEMIDAFNRGYRNEQTRFEICDENAVRVETELRTQGARIAGALRVRHAG